MGLAHGVTTKWQATQGIVQDGLVLNLDAGVKDSYNGGTTWYDLKGSNNGTLDNGPTFDSEKGGSIVSDGSDDRILITDSADGGRCFLMEQLEVIKMFLHYKEIAAVLA